jgi:tripartite-type tricarboxylate transporter receptor subunit TctC
MEKGAARLPGSRVLDGRWEIERHAIAVPKEGEQAMAFVHQFTNYMAKVKIQAIPYKGGAPALTAVIAGEIPMSVNPLPEVVGQIEGNAVRALAVTTAQRSKALSDVPTIAEAGIFGYDASVWGAFSVRRHGP